MDATWLAEAWRGPVLVGRSEQLASLDRAVQAVAGGTFAVVEICGEVGMGKTRLLAELAMRVRAAGLAVFAGRATEFERDAPYGVYVDAMRQLLDADPASGELAALRAASGSGRSADRSALFPAVRRLLDGVPAAGDAVLLDDLHWADRASLELTEYLIRKPPNRPTLIAIAYRADEPPVGVVDAIAHHGSAATRIDLTPLAPADVAALLPDLPAARRGLIQRASRGNPFYVQALSRLPSGVLPDSLLAALADDPFGEGEWLDGSSRYALAGLAAGVSALEPEVQAVAFAVALVGDHATVDLLSHVARLPVEVVVAAIDRMHRLGLVDLNGSRCGYRYPLLGAATRELAGPARRFEMHARAAAYLRDRQPSALVLAHHTERIAQYGDATAASTLIEAGMALAYESPARAARWLGAALRILPASGPLGSRRPTVALQYARALARGGGLDRSRDVLWELERAGGLARTRVATASAVVARLRGEVDEAAARLHTQMLGGRQGRAVEGSMRVEMAAICALREDPAGALEHGTRALDRLGGTRPGLVAAAHALRAFGALYSGRTDAAKECLASAVGVVDAIGDAVLRPHVELLGPLAWVETELGDLRAAARHLERARGVLRNAGPNSARPYLLVVEAALQTRRGLLAAALQAADEAAVQADLVGSAEMRAMAEAVKMRPLLWTAGPAAALAIADRLRDKHRPRAAMWWRVGQLNLALAYSAAGQPEHCRRILAAPPVQAPHACTTPAPHAGASSASHACASPSPHACASPTPWPAIRPWPEHPPSAVARMALCAIVAAESGNLTTAFDMAQRAAEIAAAAGLAYEEAVAAYARACATYRASQPVDAAELACGAAERFAAVAAPVEEALCHHLAGAAYARGGRTSRSRAAFNRAVEGYRVSGAGWLLSTVDPPGAELPTSAGAPPLTVREREIAELAAAGHSNQEIAARLYLSRRTVESHLSRVFAKLDVRSRTAMASRLNGD